MSMASRFTGTLGSLSSANNSRGCAFLSLLIVNSLVPTAGFAGEGRKVDPDTDQRWYLEARRQKTESLPHTMETLDALRRDGQAAFLAHLKRARNVKAPTQPGILPWKVDWKAQIAYCRNIADALFKRPERLSFPTVPDAALLRDGPEKVLAATKRAFSTCQTPGYEILEVNGQRRLLAQSLGKPPHLSKTPMAAWNVEHYVGDSYWVLVTHIAIPGKGLRGTAQIDYWSGKPCPNKGYGSGWNDTVYLYWSLDLRTVMGLVDDQPTVFMFGTYGHVYPARGGWVELSGTEWLYPNHDPQVGKPGQGFVFVDGLQADLYRTWALSEVEPAVLTEGVTAKDFEDGRHLMACIINFDLKK